MNKNLKYITFILTLLSVLCLSFLTFTKNKNRAINNTSVEIKDAEKLKFLEPNTVKKFIIKSFKNQIATGMNYEVIDSIEHQLKQQSFIKSVDVFVDVQKNLNIEIEQKEPIARIIDFKDNSYYLTKDAEKVHLSKIYSAPVLLIKGNLKQKEYVPIVNLITQIQQDTLLKKEITSIYKRDTNNFYLTTRFGVNFVELGNLKMLSKKLNKLKLFYTQYLQYQTENPYKKISLKFNNQIVGTKR